MVFSTINLKQTKVTKSLAYDLFEYAESRSPQKTAHNIAKLMNFKSESPFYDRLKILGKASDSERQVITQATFVDRLLRMISNDPMRDRDIIKRGGRLELVAGKEKEKFVFRNRFIREKDAETAKILWNYFAAVSKRWNSAWNDFDRGRILCRTTGFAALMRLLPDIFVKLSTDVDKNLPSVDDFYDLFEKSSLKDQEFTSDQFKPGSSGEGELYRRLSEEILK